MHVLQAAALMSDRQHVTRKNHTVQHACSLWLQAESELAVRTHLHVMVGPERLGLRTHSLQQPDLQTLLGRPLAALPDANCWNEQRMCALPLVPLRLLMLLMLLILENQCVCWQALQHVFSVSASAFCSGACDLWTAFCC